MAAFEVATEVRNPACTHCAVLKRKRSYCWA